MTIETLIARGFQVLLALGGAYLVALWFVLAVWTFRDIETRSRSVITQVFSTLLVVLFWVPGLLLYRLLRPNETLDEAYQRSLEEEYLIQDLEELPLCPSCSHFVEDDFQICPHCNTQLREPCSSCERLIDLRWEICPYCGTQHHGGAADTEKAVDVADDRWIDPASIERRLREAEERRLREETRALPAATASTTLGRELVDRPVRQTEDARIDAALPDGEQTVQYRGRQREQTHPPDVAPADASTNGTSAEQLPEQSREQPTKVPAIGPDLSSLGDSDDEAQDDDSENVGTILKRYRVK